MANLTIRPINTGYVPTFPKQYHYHHSTHEYITDISDSKVALPVFTFLIEGGKELILVDTGMAWTERADKYHHPGSYQPEGMAIHEQLAKIGYSCADIDKVIFTHMHWDHIFYMEKFNKAQFVAQREEYEFALNPIPLYYKSYEHPALGVRRPLKGSRSTWWTEQRRSLKACGCCRHPGIRRATRRSRSIPRTAAISARVMPSSFSRICGRFPRSTTRSRLPVASPISLPAGRASNS